MKNILLNNREYSLIKEYAHNLWMNNSTKNNNFMCECYVEAFLQYLKSKKLNVINGEICEQKDNK